MSDFSPFSRMVRVLTFIRRWLPARCRSVNEKTHVLAAVKLESTRLHLVRMVQAEHFSVELASLQAGNNIKQSSPLRRLTPFLDTHGILRVGGRLQFSLLGYEENHPAIVPKRSHLDDLLIWDAHRITLHGGPQLVQSYLLSRYWIVHARSLIRRWCRQCVRCVRF